MSLHKNNTEYFFEESHIEKEGNKIYRINTFRKPNQEVVVSKMRIDDGGQYNIDFPRLSLEGLIKSFYKNFEMFLEKVVTKESSLTDLTLYAKRLEYFEEKIQSKISKKIGPNYSINDYYKHMLPVIEDSMVIFSTKNNIPLNQLIDYLCQIEKFKNLPYTIAFENIKANEINNKENE